ncbi:MAG: SH3 domain-containing protein [Anaerolineae bacterium]|nr:SH3 domain-containing protein [Anaerolineae bacterium]
MKLWKVVLPLLLLLVAASGIVNAQAEASLALGQPTILQVAPGSAARNSYTVAQPSMVMLQAIGASAQPTLTIWQGDKSIAAAANEAGESVVTLTTFLDAGDYTVETGTLSAEATTIMLVVQSETPVTIAQLAAGVSLSGEVQRDAPAAIYRFVALNEPAYLSIESGLAQRGVAVRLTETAAGSELAMLDSLLMGARIHIAPGNLEYQLEVTHSGIAGAESFTICFVAASVGSCQAGGASAQPIVTAEPQPDSSCRATPNSANGANLRQTANTNAPVITAIPAGESALVSGVSPDGSFYNVVYGIWSGWVASVAVTLNGNCGALAVIVPPPLPPTAVPTLPPPPPMPTQPPAPPQSSEPCHVVFTAAEYIYAQPEADVAYLYDQVQAGGEMIPVGRWSGDPSWWKTSYGGWWLNALGTAGEVRGNCSNLPLVAWP